MDQIADTVQAIHDKRTFSVILVEQNLDFVRPLRAPMLWTGQVA